MSSTSNCFNLTVINFYNEVIIATVQVDYNHVTSNNFKAKVS